MTARNVPLRIEDQGGKALRSALAGGLPAGKARGVPAKPSPRAEREFSGPAMALMTKTNIDKTKARRPTSAAVARPDQRIGFAGIPFDSMPTTRWVTEEQVHTARLHKESKKVEQDEKRRHADQIVDLTLRPTMEAVPTPPRLRRGKAHATGRSHSRRPQTARTARSEVSLAQTIASLGDSVLF